MARDRASAGIRARNGWSSRRASRSTARAGRCQTVGRRTGEAASMAASADRSWSRAWPRAPFARARTPSSAASATSIASETCAGSAGSSRRCVSRLIARSMCRWSGAPRRSDTASQDDLRLVVSRRPPRPGSTEPSRRDHADRSPPRVERVEDVGFTELDANGPPRLQARPCAPLQRAVNSLQHDFDRNAAIFPASHLVERGSDDANQVPVVLPAQVGLDLPAVVGGRGRHGLQCQSSVFGLHRRG